MEDGTPVSYDMDRRMDFHFNAILDIIAEWRKSKELCQDVSLLCKSSIYGLKYICLYILITCMHIL